MTLPRRTLAPFAWLLLATLACGHEDPIAPGSGGATGPHTPGSPTRLTFGDRYESTPSWLPDGSGILHSFDRILGGQFDRCLGILPAAGGSRTLEFCALSPGSGDSVDALEGAGASPGGRLLYQWSQSDGPRTSPNFSQLVLATLARPWEATRLTLVPYTLPGGRMHGRVARVDWLDDERAVYLGEDVIYAGFCGGCPPDTLRIGREGVLVDLRGASPALSIIPGTEDASSLAGAPGHAYLYLTYRGDSRVYRLPAAGGVPEVFHDFGVLGIARDLALGGGRLYAIVGGRVFVASDPSLGEWQEDSGGRLFVLDLDGAGAEEIPVGGQRFLRRPSPDPTGGPGVAVEGYEYVLFQTPLGDVDTLISPDSDLWRYEAP